LRQAANAAWNCGELGSTFPAIVTPKIERAFPPAGAPTEALNPCALKHRANAALAVPALSVVELEAPCGVELAALVVVVGVRLATDGGFELPQPEASKAIAIDGATPIMTRYPGRRLICFEQSKRSALKRL
jgi:hypothetical protein